MYKPSSRLLQRAKMFMALATVMGKPIDEGQAMGQSINAHNWAMKSWRGKTHHKNTTKKSDKNHVSRQLRRKHRRAN